MRRTATLLALIAAGAALAACGKGGYTVTAVSPAAAGTTATVPHVHDSGPSSRAQALAFARAVNLTSTDLPGFTPTAKHEHESADEQRLERELAACVGTAASAAGARGLGRSPATVAQMSSPNFELRRGVLALTASSEVSVAHSSAQAAATLAAIRNPRVRACFTRYFTSLLKSQHFAGGTLAGVKISSGTPPAPGTTGGFAWRITATFAIRGIDLSFYLDLLGFVDGPAQVTLTSTGTVRPFPAAAEEQLYTELLTRARSHTP